MILSSLLLVVLSAAQTLSTQEIPWLITNTAGHKALFDLAAPEKVDILVKHLAKYGATKEVLIHASPDASRFFSEDWAKDIGERMLNSVIPEPTAGAALPSISCALDVYVDTAPDGSTCHVTSLLRMKTERTRAIGDAHGFYSDAVIYETPMVQMVGTAMFDSRRIPQMIAQAANASLDHLRNQISFAENAPSDPIKIMSGIARLDNRTPTPIGAGVRLDTADQPISRDDLLRRMRERGVIVSVEEVNENPKLRAWFHQNDLGSVAITRTIKDWLDQAGIPVMDVNQMPDDRPIPYQVSCQLMLDVLEAPVLGANQWLLGASCDLQVMELFAFGPGGSLVLSCVGVWTAPIHMKNARMPSYNVQQVAQLSASVLGGSAKELLGGILPSRTFERPVDVIEETPQEAQDRSRARARSRRRR